MFKWSDERIMWYLTASKWTGYHALLAVVASEFLYSDDEVCDVGCGPGCLAVELAPRVRQVTAVDVDDRVLQCIRDRTAADGIKNVRPVLADYAELPENCCDVVVACSFGVMEKNAYEFMRLARKRMIMIKRKDPAAEKDGFTTAYGRKHKSFDDEKYLDEHHIPYLLYTFDGEFGQPLHDREEALRYLDYYGSDGEESADELLKRCEIADPESAYRYYIPNKKEVHMLIIEKADLMKKTL